MRKKNYFVSIPLRVPANFETTVEAKSKEAAVKVALDRYRTRRYDPDEISEPFWNEHELDIREQDDGTKGIFIEEQKATPQV